MKRAIIIFLAAFWLCGFETRPPTPADLYGPLFERVQLERLFTDGKSFVDAVPKRPPADIMADYQQSVPADRAALAQFVAANFTVPGAVTTAAGTADTAPAGLLAHIRALWPQLTRPPLDPPAGSSALALPAPYVVPGGRFREIYYWDSYFTMLGLMEDGQQQVAEGMVEGFESLITRYGHIPNGTRTYYLSRSQPPFFALMLDLLPAGDIARQRRHLDALRQEHAYWMDRDGCEAESACQRTVRMPDGTLLNRYWDDRDTPRDESFAEDVETAAKASRPPSIVYRDLRAAAESGWDFSARWLGHPDHLFTIGTSRIVPIDLNSLLWAMEQAIARRCAALTDQKCATRFKREADRRAAAIHRYLWEAHRGLFVDWDMDRRESTGFISAATLYPLFVGLATPQQATEVAKVTRDRLVAPGGLRTSLRVTHHQWDAPNGWPPLQWVAVQGLARYGEEDLALEIARRWVATVDRAYRDTGKLLEKYNVEEQLPGGGGEYPLQDGFGWTNGVTRALIARYPQLDPDR